MMVDISEMTPLEKSEALVKLNSNWEIKAIRFDFSGNELYRIEVIESPEVMWFLDRDTNLFTTDRNGDPHFMPLAWRVLNWALQQNQPVRGDLEELWEMPFGDELFGYLSAISPNDDGLSVFEMPPAEARAAWLDKILSLAIEAGKITAESDLEEGN
jgi:hypothetical protein